MTSSSSREIAEKIAGARNGFESDGEAICWIEALIDGALNKAAADSQTTMKEIAFRWKKEARSAALEEVAKIADKMHVYNDSRGQYEKASGCLELAAKIRALQEK